MSEWLGRTSKVKFFPASGQCVEVTVLNNQWRQSRPRGVGQGIPDTDNTSMQNIQNNMQNNMQNMQHYSLNVQNMQINSIRKICQNIQKK